MLSTKTIEKVAAGAVIGTLIGGSYGALRAFLSTPGYAERLNPKPECFHVDAGVAKVFCDLATHRALDESLYVESMHNADSLFCLEEQLRLGEVKPTIVDPVTATSYAVRSLTHLRNLRKNAQDESTYNDISNNIKSLELILSNHLANIEKICKAAE